MYTKNPVTGRNETLVNTSMLKGAVDGVVAKIADKADKGALDSLSAYAVGIAEELNDKANKSEVQSLSEYVEGRLPKTVYTPLVDAYVGLACKVADPDVLEGAAKMAYAANPDKYATSNPADEGCANVTTSGSTIYKAVRAAGSTVELPPFLRLKSWGFGGVGDITSWKTELPNLTEGTRMFTDTLFTSWNVELPNLTDGLFMFDGSHLTTWDIELCHLTNGTSMFASTGLTTWNVELPNLTDGSGMFYNTGLTSWTTELPNLTKGSEMFKSCTGLTSWTTELPNLTNAEVMFSHTSIEEWNVELPKLTNGSGMFCDGSSYNPDTPAALKRFRGTLPALVDGAGMFTNCQLDLESIRCIAETINDVNGLTEDREVTKRLDICVGYDIEHTPLHEEYVESIKDKGWRVTVNDIVS